MFADGSFAVAVVRNQVTIVRATRTHTKNDKVLDVHAYRPFGEGIFLAADVPSARISASDVLTVLSPVAECNEEEMIQLPSSAYSQYLECTTKHHKRHESLWSSWIAKH